MNFRKRYFLLLLLFLFIGSYSVQAREIGIYVNNQYLKRDIQNVDGFDMLPILDIAQELGYSCVFDGTTAILSNDAESYTFQIDNPAVFDKNEKQYGLDVVPQMLNGKFMIPAKFIQDVVGKSYIWDEITDTVFLGSESSYEWLVSTPEYQADKRVKDAQKAVCGLWGSNEVGDDFHTDFIEFKPDGTCYYRAWNWRSGAWGFGKYLITTPDLISVEYNYYGVKESPNNSFDDYIGDYLYSERIFYTISNGRILSDDCSFEKWGNNTNEITMFSPNREIAFINQSDIQAWINEGWYTEPVSYVYAPDGRCEIISVEDITAWESVGWTANPYISMYALDGRVEQVKMWDVPNWESVGWYTEPVIKMYSDTGKSCIVKLSEINSYKAVGWHRAHEIVFGKTLNQINHIFGTANYYDTIDGGYIYKTSDMFFGFPIHSSDRFYNCTYFGQKFYQVIPESIFYAYDNGNINISTLLENTEYPFEVGYSEKDGVDVVSIYIDGYWFCIDCDKYGNFNIFYTAELYLSQQPWYN